MRKTSHRLRAARRTLQHRAWRRWRLRWWGRTDEALRVAELVARDEPGSARAAYLLGRARAAEGDGPGAAEAWRRARDLDALRFRAPTAFRAILEETAAATGATLVDAEARFRQASPYGAVGDELMLEHLHPNVDGYFLLADAFHDSLLDAGIPGPPARAVDDATARAEVPLSAAEIHFANYKLLRLVNDWPFTDVRQEPELPAPRNLEEQLGQALYRQEIDWATMQDRLKRAYRSAGDEREYLRLSLILADAFPFVAPAQKDAGEALLAARRPTQAYRYFFRAAGYAPGDVEALKGLARAAVAIGLEDQARRALDRVLELSPGDAAARRLRQELDD
ncbi:MAG: tetratricopeptide repeat protein [Gammaproteobacteria bacterium]